MQPPLEWHLKPLTLPEAQSQADYLCVVVKRYKYISIAVTPRTGTQDATLPVFTLHQVEAKKLAHALLDAAAAPPDLTFRDHILGGVEGIYLGGPPRREQLAEFNPSPISNDAKPRVE